MYYTVRVELHNATHIDYEALHRHMQFAGFSRTIIADNGQKFQLPPAEYSYVGNDSQQQVLTAAKQAAAKTKLNCAVLVTAGQSRIWEGLQPIANNVR